MGSSFYGGNKNSFYGGSGFYGGGDFEPELTVIDKVPYVFRKTGGDINVKKKTKQETIVGGTVAWNQWVRNGNFASDAYWQATGGSIAFSANTMTFTTGADVTSNARFFESSTLALRAEHVILFSLYVRSSVNTRIMFGKGIAASGNYGIGAVNVEANTETIVERIGKVASGNIAKNLYVYININSDLSEGDTVEFRNFAAFDLTQMFGDTIANYVRSLEQSNAGAGVAWFKKLFPNDYYAYDTGTLRSVQTVAHRTIGFNAWDEDYAIGYWDSGGNWYSNSSGYMSNKTHIRVIPNMTYCITIGKETQFYIAYYDANKNFIRRTGPHGYTISNRIFTTPNNCYYICFSTARTYGTTYLNDICFNLSLDGKKDGTYKPYVEHIYSLDDSLTLRGVSMLDENNKLYYNGDTYASDGTVTRRYGVVDLGTLSWTYNASYDYPYFVTDLRNVIQYFYGQKYLTSKYVTIDPAGLTDFGSDPRNMVLCPGYANPGQGGNVQYLKIRDNNYTDASAFQAALSGIYLIYELATPTTESADSYTNPQIIDPYGTEEFIDAGVEAETRDVAIPVGHETTYKVKGN